MKKLSTWGRDHKWSARFIIVVSLILLDLLAVKGGSMLLDIGISLPTYMIMIFATIYGIVFIGYPNKSGRSTRQRQFTSYIYRKCCDFLLAASTFCMILFLGNHPERLFRYDGLFNIASASSPSSSPGDSIQRSYKSIAAFSKSMKSANGVPLKWKERKRLLKAQIRAIRNSPENSKGTKVLLIVLSVLGALLLLYAVAALACSLSCAGSDAAAVIVGVLGVALIVFLLVLAIRGIQHKKITAVKEPQTAPSS
jgi:hypothetical protein